MRPHILLIPAITLSLHASNKVEAPKLMSEEAAKLLVENCLKNFVAGDYKTGLDLFKPYWAAPANEIDTLVMQTLTTRNAVRERFGNSIGYEFISQQHAGKSFLRFVAIEKLQNTAIRYLVVFYKAEDHWVVQNFYWDDKVQLLFTE
jgi:hypothetical protein